LQDDVPREVKVQRVTEVNDIFREQWQEMNLQQVGETQLVLVEGVSPYF
jgi:tRNA A37 methylthiotransferase MiaB